MCYTCVQADFSPTLKQLATIVGSVFGDIANTLADIKRLPDILTRSKSLREVSTVVLTFVVHFILLLQDFKR